MKAVTVRLDDKGRCCGRKPLQYKRPKPGHLFCDRCYAEFTADGQQRANWAWLAVPGGGFWPPPQANEMHLADAHRKANALLAAEMAAVRA